MGGAAVVIVFDEDLFVALAFGNHALSGCWGKGGSGEHF